MKNCLLLYISILLILSCRQDSIDNAFVNSNNESIDVELVKLKQNFKTDLISPMQIVRDTNYYHLIDNPASRMKVRSLIKEFANESRTVMVRPEEEGAPIQVKGKILSETDSFPVPNVLIELVHTDHDGLYFSEKSKWNPRIFAYLKSDENGEFYISTILPGRYKDDEGNEVPSHIHFTLEKEGYRVYGSEFTFDDDPVFRANGNVDQVPVATRISEDSVSIFEVVLFMQED